MGDSRKLDVVSGFLEKVNELQSQSSARRSSGFPTKSVGVSFDLTGSNPPEPKDAQEDLLQVLSDQEAWTVPVLHKKSGLSLTEFSGTIGQLESMGLVLKEISSPGQVAYQITPSGLAVLGKQPKV